MIIVTNTPEYLSERINAIENTLAEICIRGTELHESEAAGNPEAPAVEPLVPADTDYARIASLRRELLDITDGKNTIMLDKLGRPSIAQVFECDNSVRVDRYKDLLGLTASNYTKDWENILPCFKREGRETRYLLIQKYRCIRYNGKNVSLGMFGLPQAYGQDGFEMSYDGINAECDRVNKGHMPGLDIHELTWDEFGWLALSSAYNNFEPHGNTNKGAYWATEEAGAPCGLIINNEFVNTLTGSGPDTWSLYASRMGIADIIGNTKIILSGVRTKGGEIQLIDFRNTTGTLTAEQLGSTSGLWKSIVAKAPETMRLFATKEQQVVTEFGAIGAEGSYKIDFAGEGQAHRINTVITPTGTEVASKTVAKNVALAENVADSALLRYMGFLPYAVSERASAGEQHMVNHKDAENYIAVGADWNSLIAGGFGCKDNTIKSNTHSDKLGGLLASYTDILEY